MQTLSLNRLLHEIRLGNHRRDRQADRDGHTTQLHHVPREALVATAHVARVEVGIRAHGREVEREDGRFGQHGDADVGGLAPDTVQLVPGRVSRDAGGEEGGE